MNFTNKWYIIFNSNMYILLLLIWKKFSIYVIQFIGIRRTKRRKRKKNIYKTN